MEHDFATYPFREPSRDHVNLTSSRESSPANRLAVSPRLHNEGNITLFREMEFPGATQSKLSPTKVGKVGEQV